ncbi:MAG: RNA polymerase sigma factor [Nannocystales bacterium]
MTTKKPPSSSLPSLMLRYIDGDRRAFDQLATRIEPRLRRFLERRVRNPDLVDDLLQQTFLRVHASRSLYRTRGENNEGSVEAWFTTTAQRTLLDHMRGEYRRRARVDRLSNLPDASGFGTSPHALTPEQRLSTQEQEDLLRETVRSAVRALPHDAREVVQRHKFEGQTMQRIASDLGVGVGTLRVRAHRAYRKLAEVLVSSDAQPKLLATLVAS